MHVTQQTLSNGVTVILAPRAGTQAATVMVMARAGSLDESASDAGIAHFLEHVVFKGTPSRPSAFTITRELDGLGASYNAFTSHEYTAYIATVRKNHVRDAVSVLADIYINATLPADELEKEKGVVLEEIKMYRDEPQQVAYDAHLLQAYGDNPAGRPIIGTPESVQGLRPDTVTAFRDRRYTSNNTVVVVTGAIEEANALALVREFFADVPSGEEYEMPEVASSPSPCVQMISRDSDQAHGVWSVPGVPRTDPEYLVSRVTAQLLGGTMSSRLFQRVREELGVAYYVGAEAASRKTHGLFLVYAGTDVHRTAEAWQAIQAVISGLLSEQVTDEEVRRAKESLLGGIALGFESSSRVAQFLAREWLTTGAGRTQQDIESELLAITSEHVHGLAEKLFNQPAHLTLVGPHVLQKQSWHTFHAG